MRTATLTVLACLLALTTTACTGSALKAPDSMEMAVAAAPDATWRLRLQQ